MIRKHFSNNMTEEEQIEYVQQNWENIQYIDHPNEVVQLAVVKHNGYAIQYIKNPNKEIQLAAVKQNGYAIMFIEDPTFEVQLESITTYISAIEWIKNPSLDIQLAAIQKDIYAIRCISNPKLEVRQYIANNINFNELLEKSNINTINSIQYKIRDYITKEIYYKAPKDFPWIPEIKEKFKDIDRFKRFNL